MSTQSSDAPAELVSLADAAEALGVHYMTAYRYVRTGRMYAVKQGGKWWVEQTAIQDIRAEGTGRRSSVDGKVRELLVEPFTARLLAGDAGGCWDLVTDALRSGAAPAEVHQRLLHPALVEVGRRWADGEITIAAEHRATATANRLIGQMGPMFRHPGRRRGTVVLGSVAQDPHGLPSAMLGDLLADQHLDVVDLGANTPAASFVETASEVDDLVGVGICVTLDHLAHMAESTAAEVRRALPDTLIVVGGSASALRGPQIRDTADHVTSTADEATQAFLAAALSDAVTEDDATEGDATEDDATKGDATGSTMMAPVDEMSGQDAEAGA